MRRETGVADGAAWVVEIDWVARRIRNPWRRTVDAIRERRAARKARRAQREGRGANVLDAADLAATGSDLDDYLAIVAAVIGAVVAVIALVWLLPVVWAIVAVLVEVFVLTLIAIAVLLWRTLFRRPWNVVARRGDDRWVTRVVGYRRARALVRTLSADLEAGVGPEAHGLERVAV